MENNKSINDLLINWILPLLISFLVCFVVYFSEKPSEMEDILFIVNTSFLPTFLTLGSSVLMYEFFKTNESRRKIKKVFMFVIICLLFSALIFFAVSCFTKTLVLFIISLSSAFLLIAPSIALVLCKDIPSENDIII